MQKKKMKLWEKILIIIWILLVLFLINIVRNYIIYEKIFRLQSKYVDSKNYSYIREDYNNKDVNDKAIMIVKYKDGKCLLNLQNGNNIFCNLYNEQTKDIMFINIKGKNATITKSDFMLGIEKPFVIENMTFKEKLLKSIISCIYSSNINGQKCYCIRIGKYYEAFISKENGIPLKVRDGKALIDDKEYDCYTEIKEWKTEKVNDEDVAVPDLTDYEIIDKRVKGE